jgi:alpha-amylase
MKKTIIWLTVLLFTVGIRAQQNEVLYQVSQRSFFDSNGDGNGDLRGMQQKLDYLQNMGVTTLLLAPLYHSDFYNNYSDAKPAAIDPLYGEFKEYRELVVEVHRRKMKIYQDVELLYVTDTHPWFKESYKNPSSKYSSYLYYNDKKNEKPNYIGAAKSQWVMVNVKETQVKAYINKVLKFWMDPNGDGAFNDGTDGFRLGSMADTAGHKNLLRDFWNPLIADLKKVNPLLQIVAGPSDTNSYGFDYFTKANVDKIFALKMREAIAAFDKNKIAHAADSTFINLPNSPQPLMLLENSVVGRLASVQDINPGKLRVAAALTLLIGGMPSIYYGQELGMKGTQPRLIKGVNNMPLQEAFEWYAAEEGPGMALWYKGTGQAWDNRSLRANDGISLEEEQKDPKSLHNFYRQLLKLRKTHSPLSAGTYKETPNSSDKVFSFIRTAGRDKALIVINLSGTEQHTLLEDNTLKLNIAKLIFGDVSGNFSAGGRGIMMPPYGVQVWRFPPAGPAE